MKFLNKSDIPLLRWLIIAIVVVISLVACNAEVVEVPHTIIDNKIIAEDVDIKITTDYIKQGSGWIYPEITYKNLPGTGADIDLVFGVNTDEMRFIKAEYWNPHYEEWETTHQQDFYNVEIVGIYDGTELDYGNSYNTYKRIIIHDVANGTHTDRITSNVSFDSYQEWDGHYTVFWYTDESGIVDWSSIPSDRITVHDIDYNEKNVWYSLDDVYVLENELNKLRIYVELKHGIGDRSYKYDIATKLSFDTLQEAVTNNRLKLIDPYGDATNFNSTWNTSKTSTGSTNNTSIKLPLEAAGTYDFTVWWGDGNSDNITVWNQANVTHNYSSQGEYNVVIDGTITGWRFNNGGDRLKITNITNWGNLNLGNSNGYFYGCSNLNVGATDTLDLTGTITFQHAFYGCSGLTSLNTSNWDTSSVTHFNYAFYGCSGLTTLDVSNWDTSSVTTFGFAFRDCFSLTTLNVSNWDISSVIYLHEVFYGCSGLTTLNTTNWNTLNVIYIYGAFRDCSGLTTLDTSNWDTSSVTSFSHTFSGCSGLTAVTGIGSLNVSLVTSMINMFNGVTLNTTNYNSLLTGWASQSLINDTPFHGGNSIYSCDAESARNDTLIGVYNWTITDGGLTGGPCAPTITLVSFTPDTFYTNYTGTITISYMVESNNPLNLSSLAFLYGLNYTIPAGGDMHNYISGPPNSIAYDGLYRAPHRNLTPYLSWEDNATITNGSVWQWGGYDNDSTELSTSVINATHTWVNVTGVTEDVLASSFYLSKTEMYNAPKTGFEVSRAQGLIFKMWNVEEIRNRDANYLANLYFDTTWESTMPTYPIEIGYCNDSYDPATDDIDVSPYCTKFAEWNGTRWIDHSWDPSANASYASPLTINASQFTSPSPDDTNYIWLRSYTISSKSFVLNATNYDPGICNLTYAQTNTMWTYNEINGQTDAVAYTPSFFTTFARNDEDLLHHLYIADTGGEWGHSEIFNESIGLSTVPVSPVSFEHFNASCGTVYVNDTQMDATYNNGTMDIYIHCPADPDGGSVSHNITLHYGNNQSLVAVINNTLTTTGDEYVDVGFDTTTYYSGSNYYTLKCVSTDDEGSVATKWLLSDFTLDADGNQGWISNGAVHFWGFNDIPTLYTTISNNSLMSYNAGDDIYTMHIPFFKSQYNDTFNFNETVHLKSLNNEDISYFRFLGKTVLDNATIIGWNTTSDTPAPITDTYRAYTYSLTTVCGNITNSNFSYLGSDFYRQEGLNFVDNSHEYLIHNTTFSHNAEGPIMEECTNFTISNCTITDNVNVGVGVYFTNNTIIENNTISSNGGRGVSVYEGNDNTIRYNEIIDSDVHGINLWSNSINNTCTGNNITGSTIYDYYILTSSTDNYIIDPASSTDKIRVTSSSSVNIENSDNTAFTEDSINTSYAYPTNFSMHISEITQTFNVTQRDMTITPSTDNLGIWNLVFASSVSFNASSNTAYNPTWYNITNSLWANHNISVYRNGTLFANETADATGFMDYNYSDSYSEKWFEFTLGDIINYNNFSFTNISVSPITVLQGHSSIISIDISDFDGTITTAIVKIKDTNYTMTNTVGDTWSYTYSNNYVGKHYITDFYAQDNNLAWNSTTSTSYINVLASSGSGGGFVIVPTVTPTITPEPTPTPIIEKEYNITLPAITIITDESINIFKLVNWFGKTEIESTVEANGIVQCIINDNNNNFISECDVHDGVIYFTFNPVIDNIYNTNTGTITMIDDTGNEHKTNVVLSTLMWWPLLIIVGFFYILIKIYTKTKKL